jgi:hypothetical protein
MIRAFALLLISAGMATGAAGRTAQPAPAALPSPLFESMQGSSLRAEDLRVATIGYRLALAGREFCPIQGPLTGMLLHNLAEYRQADRPGLIAQGMDRGPAILSVVAGGPADSAGLHAGDVLLAADGAVFPSPTAIAAIADEDAWRLKAEANEKMLLDRLAQGPVTLTVLRGAETLSLTLAPRTGCALRIRLARTERKGAWTVRGHVVVTTALFALAANDDELAFLIAHELAHIVLGHTALLDSAGVPRAGMFRGVGRNRRVVRETEVAADQLGGRIMLAAGFDPGKGALVLRRWSAGPRIGLFETHDSDDARIRAMQALGKPGAPR